jgi:aspartate-semialdehyde dehydrogenase
MRSSSPRIGVIGATGAVGRVAVGLLRERGYDDLRVFASARSAGADLDGLRVEEATPDALAEAELEVALFSVGTAASRELVPHAVRGGAVAIDKSAAFRLQDGVPLVVPEVNAHSALAHQGIVANPNCCTIPLACVLKPLHDAARLRRVRIATYQSASGAGASAMARLSATSTADADLSMDWEYDGEEFDEESKLRAETRKIMDLPELPIHASCVRVPVLVGHAEAVWLETEDPLSPEDAMRILATAPSVELAEFPTPKQAVGRDTVLVGRIRRDSTEPRGLSLFLACDNLRKGAALNAIQIAELVLEGAPLTRS